MTRALMLAWARQQLRSAWKREDDLAKQHWAAVDACKFWGARVRELEEPRVAEQAPALRIVDR